MAKLPGELLLYIKACGVLKDLTPISADCGELCGRRCCQGDEHAGMLLFPHEELLWESAGYRLVPGKMLERAVWMAVCDGRCRRAQRPLSCRIYPYVPILREGRIEVIPDPRAKPFCPLLHREAAPYIQPDFLESIRRVFTPMLKSPVIRAFLVDYTAMLEDYRRFTGGLR